MLLHRAICPVMVLPAYKQTSTEQPMHFVRALWLCTLYDASCALLSPR